MKLLCLCRGGNVRSVAAKMILHRYFGHETLAAGWETNSPETTRILLLWADAAVVMHEDFITFIPGLKRTFVLHVGNDLWGNPFAEDLQLMIFDLVMAEPLLRNGKNPERDALIRKLRIYREKIEQRNATDAAV